MRTLRFLALGALALSLSLGACKKDNDSKSVRDILIEGQWDLTAATIDPPFDVGGGITISNLLIDEDACDADDLTIFNADGTATGDEGATKCDPSDPQQYSNGTWTLNADETVLTISDAGEVFVFTVASATDNQLKLTISADQFDDDFPSTSTVTFTFTKV